jgi:hypothetical protein
MNTELSRLPERCLNHVCPADALPLANTRHQAPDPRVLGACRSREHVREVDLQDKETSSSFDLNT